MFKVTNNNDFDLLDRYDGQDYFFPKGKTVMCPDDAARHFFGVGDPNKLPYLTRQGWLRASDKLDDAMVKLDNFAFDVIVQKYDVEFALIEQRLSPSATAGDEEETGADDSAGASSPATTGGKPPRNILKRIEQAQA